jgi:hypothetical protein
MESKPARRLASKSGDHRHLLLFQTMRMIKKLAGHAALETSCESTSKTNCFND